MGPSLIVVGSTVAPWKCNGSDELAWVKHFEAMREAAAPIELEIVVAAQYRMGELTGAYARLSERLEELGRHLWTQFALGEIWTGSTRGRLIGITTGRNLIREYALRDTFATHVLFLDSDVEPDPDCIPKLLELDHPVVGGDVPSYCLKGPEVDVEVSREMDGIGRVHKTNRDARFPFPVQEHWNSAGFLLVQRDVLRQVAWRWDPDTNTTDDPSFATDVERAGFGKTWVRKDVIGKHPQLIPVEARK